MLDQLASAMHLFAGVIAQRTGHEANAMEVRTLAGAVVGVVIAVQFAMVEDPAANFAALLDEAMGHIESGLELGLGRTAPSILVDRH